MKRVQGKKQVVDNMIEFLLNKAVEADISGNLDWSQRMKFLDSGFRAKTTLRRTELDTIFLILKFASRFVSLVSANIFTPSEQTVVQFGFDQTKAICARRPHSSGILSLPSTDLLFCGLSLKICVGNPCTIKPLYNPKTL